MEWYEIQWFENIQCGAENYIMDLSYNYWKHSYLVKNTWQIIITQAWETIDPLPSKNTIIMKSRSKEQDQLAQEAMLTKDFLYSVSSI